MSYFYDKFKNHTEIELFEKVNNPSSYQEEAVIAAINILIERGVELSAGQIAIKQDYEIKDNIDITKNKTKETSIGRSRFLAFLIDLIILAVCSYVIGFILMYLSLANEYITISASAILIIGYFSIGNSKFFSGSTFGKRKMNLSVVGKENESITFKQSILRSLLFLGPFFIFQILTKIEINSTFLSIILSTLKISYFVAIIFYFLVDKNLRRLYHDLIQETIVSKNKNYQKLENIPKKFSAYFGAIVLVIFIVNIAINFNSLAPTSVDDETVEQLQATLDENMEVLTLIGKEIQGLDDIRKINGLNIKTTNNTQTDFIIDIQTEINPMGNQGDNLADKIYGTLNGKTLNIEKVDNVKVIMSYGFNMTLAKYNVEKTKNYKQ